MEYGIIRGLCWYRIFAALWSVIIVIVSYEKLIYPSYAVMAAGALVIISLTIQQISLRDPSILMRSEIVMSELIFAVLITLLGGYMYKHGMSNTTLAFASQYILASVLMTGVAFGLSGGMIGGVVIGLSRAGASVINQTAITPSHALSLLSTMVTYCLAGALVGGVVTILRKAGGELSEARARDSIARTLHDGVLQTLVIIKKRSKEPEIADIAGHQEQELRSFLFTHQSNSSTPALVLHKEIEGVVETFSNKNNIPVAIVISPDIGELSRASTKALINACTECLTNIAKHSDATTVTIYAESDDNTCTLSVRDDGKGFDVDAELGEKSKDGEYQKHGLKSSIIGRVQDVGGIVTIKSAKDNGTEVEMCVSLDGKKPSKIKVL